MSALPPADLSRFALLAERLAPRLLGRNDATGDALAERVRALSHLYTRDREALSERSSSQALLAARLRFFFVRDLPKVHGPLEELLAAGLLPERRAWTVLDLGAGVGTTSLGAAAFAAENGLADRLEILALDREREPLSIFEALAKHGRELALPELALETRVADFGRATPPGPFDLVLLGFALNEWVGERSPEDVAAFLRSLGESLAADGSIIVLEPALRGPSRVLHAVRDALVARAEGVSVFAPCLHRGPCPMLETERDWCHEDRPARLPEALVPVARAAGLRYERATYAYLVLRRDGRSRADGLGGAAGTPYRVVSQPMKSKGKLELFLCGEGGRARAMRLERHATDSNAAFGAAERGDALVVDAPREGERLRIGPTTHVSSPEERPRRL